MHENCSKFFQWFKITGNQFTVNYVICDVVFVNNNTANSLLMNFDCPVDISSSQHTQLVSRRTGSKPTAQISLPNSPDLNPLDYHVWGECWRPITSAIRNRKRSPNWRKSCRWSRTGCIMDSLPQGPMDKAVKEFSKRLMACVAAEGGHFEHSQ